MSSQYNETSGFLDEVDDIKIDDIFNQFKINPPKNLKVTAAQIWTIGGKVPESQVEEQPVERLTSLSTDNKHPWVSKTSSFNLYRPYPVYRVPAHISVETLQNILLRRQGDANVVVEGLKIDGLQNKTIQEIYDEFMKDTVNSQEKNLILDLQYDHSKLASATKPWKHLETIESYDASVPFTSQQLNSFYVPEMSFFKQFESKGGVTKIINVSLSSLKLWKNKQMAEHWKMWLEELYSFSQIPLFFQMFLKNQKCKALLFQILAGEPDGNHGDQSTETKIWNQKHKDAVQTNYTILSEVFSVSNGNVLREKAMECGLIPRILKRLAQISGEKPRKFVEKEEVIEEEKDEEEEKKEEEDKVEIKPEAHKKPEIKKKKGVGYSSKQGQTFDVNAYLENSKKRNEHIKTLVDILSAIFAVKEWTASKEITGMVLESALLPLLEQNFRNGSWLDMAKQADVYTAYLALARSFTDQEHLVSCLDKIDEAYEPIQRDSIYQLLEKLKGLAEVFLMCLDQQKVEDSSEGSEKSKKLAQDVMDTYQVAKNALEHLKQEGGTENDIENALSLPLPDQYRALLSNMRFDYTDMKDELTNQYVHHYKNLAE